MEVEVESLSVDIIEQTEGAHGGDMMWCPEKLGDVDAEALHENFRGYIEAFDEPAKWRHNTSNFWWPTTGPSSPQCDASATGTRRQWWQYLIAYALKKNHRGKRDDFSTRTASAT